MENHNPEVAEGEEAVAVVQACLFHQRERSNQKRRNVKESNVDIEAEVERDILVGVNAVAKAAERSVVRIG